MCALHMGFYFLVFFLVRSFLSNCFSILEKKYFDGLEMKIPGLLTIFFFSTSPSNQTPIKNIFSTLFISILFIPPPTKWTLRGVQYKLGD